MHGDHLGDRRIEKVNDGTCAKPKFPVKLVPSANSVQIAHAKKAKTFTGSEMPRMLGAKLKALGGNPKDSQLVRFGALRKVGGVAITTVPAAHSNGLGGAFIGGELGKSMAAAGLTAYVGPPTGYVLKFSNGLAVYLSADTGITAEQDLVVRGHYGAKLAVINIGNVFTTGPAEAAYVVNSLVKPNSVIASHANEEATSGGKVRAGTKTEKFSKMANMPVHVPLSGNTMEFDASGKCVTGC